jgi:hypothetical protein
MRQAWIKAPRAVEAKQAEEELARRAQLERDLARKDAVRAVREEEREEERHEREERQRSSAEKSIYAHVKRMCRHQ